MIQEDILVKYGAVTKELEKGETLFQEGATPAFYYQVLAGEIRLVNYNDKGKAMIQGIFNKGEGFAAPAIIGNYAVCSDAEATQPASLICLERRRFLKMLSENNDISLMLLEYISKRLQFKTMVAKEINCHEAEVRILNLLKFLKQESGQKGEYRVALTRQTLADIIGLRVETAIRAIKNLEDKNHLKVKNRKLYL